MNIVYFKIVYLVGVFVNILTMNVIKYIGMNGILSVKEMVCMRTIFATLILLPFNFKELVSLKNENNKTLLMLLALGVVAAFDTYMWNIGIQTVPLNNAMILLFISPIITAIMSAFILKEKITLNIKLKFLINVCAVFLIYRFSIGNLTIGYLYIMTDFVIYGIIAILIKKLNKFSSNFLVFIRLIVLLPISILFLDKIPVFNTKIAIFIFLIVFGYVTERTLITLAFRKIPVVEVQPLRYLNIVFSAGLSYLILNEQLTTYQVIGSMIIISGGLIIDNLIKKIKKV